MPLGGYFQSFQQAPLFYMGVPHPLPGTKKFEMVRAKEPIVKEQKECPSEKNESSGKQGTQHN